MVAPLDCLVRVAKSKSLPSWANAWWVIRDAIRWADMEQGSTIRHWISKVVPGYAAIDNIDKTKKEFLIEGRTYHRPQFGTPDGKAVLFQYAIPELVGEWPEPIATDDGAQRRTIQHGRLRRRGFVSWPRATRFGADALRRHSAVGLAARSTQ